MKRGHAKLPVYRPSGTGSARTLPFTRPTEDSIYKPCEVEWCGGTKPVKGETSFKVSVFHGRTVQGASLFFCSWGCAGRFCAVQEIRQ